MRATRVLFASECVIFLTLLFFTFLHLDARADLGGRAALGAFEFFGAVVSLYLLSNGRPGKASLIDWLGCAFAVMIALVGFGGTSITLFALYLFFRDREDQSTRAAATVAGAVAVQAVWAPLIFSKISFILLQIDAGVVGWLVSR